jgi:glycosyltransferase involved in cell wall biosynthesis
VGNGTVVTDWKEKMRGAVTVVTPTIPPRTTFLTRAVESVSQQSHPAAAHAIAIDVDRRGAAATRQRALDMAKTSWVAFLDDDDWFMPFHIEHLLKHALDTSADFVYSWFQVVGGHDPFPPTHFSRDFDPSDPIETTITTLVKTELAQEIGFRPLDRGEFNSGEDRYFLLGCLAAGAKISHLKERTWYWAHHGGNTSGLPNRW